MGFGRPDVTAGVVITGSNGQPVGVSRSDAASLVADPVLTAVLGWNLGENTHLQVAGTFNIPVGEYREGELANLSFHRFAADFSVAATWHDPEAGWDVSGKVGVTFNGRNDVTDYESGTDLHLEASVQRMVSDDFSIGVQAYHFQQITGDSGSGARLGPFKGRATGLGVTAAYDFEVGEAPVTLRGRVFTEFNVENRLEGTAAMLSLSFPIAVSRPPAPPSTSSAPAFSYGQLPASTDGLQ